MPRLIRHIFIALLVVVLPLRAWAGDIMAVDMAAIAVVQAKTANASSPLAMPADCAIDMQASVDESAPHCSNCDTCELCLVVANLVDASWPANQLTRHSSPLPFDANFSSARGTLSLKPPIF